MIRRLAGALLFVLAASTLNAASEIVVAIRYLQAQGESHSHLFLYREDGTLLRQLTKEESGQDLDPIFAPDGETIVFTREMAENKFEYWSVEPNGARPPRAPPFLPGRKSKDRATTKARRLSASAPRSFARRTVRSN